MIVHHRVWFGFCLSMILFLCLPLQVLGQYDSSHFSEIRGRSIGPAGMSGRVASIDVVPGNPNIIFVGASTGGVWRSNDGGLAWEPIFDEQNYLGIGAVAVSPVNPDLVWVGTGEGNPRNSAGVGNGIFRSIDGGNNWTQVGLEGSERIDKIIPHPSDANVAYAAVMGPAWSDGEVRGVYRTENLGETWERILYSNPRTGAADISIDPLNPDKIFAAMWEFRRWPWFFESGGEGSGLFISHDGGDTWRESTQQDGFPEGDLGRIGLAVSPSNPEVVYALVEATRSELLRSDDGGDSWVTISDESGIAPRPFYYADIRIDPTNENRIYSLHGSIEVSEDQGKSFRTVVSSSLIHGDVQELWINPDDGKNMIMGNDGGLAFTSDGGAHWRFVENLTLAQFYHISLDDATPYNVYGGLQDNGSWFGPNTVWENRGIMNLHWRRIGPGDGFSAFSDKTDDRYGYSTMQGGRLVRFDKATGQRIAIQPVHPDNMGLRFNWNAALNVDPLDPAALYLGSQFVHRTRDHGKSWEIISPDLTTDEPEKQLYYRSGGLTLDTSGAEAHTSILSISPSPLRKGLIWVSTDDGNIQVTEDDGMSWKNVGEGIPDVPAGTWAPHVEPSHHDENVAYVVLEDHRRGNWAPYVYKTEDIGKTWKGLANNEISGFAHVIREDPIEPNLLYLGTEFGVRVSIDGGDSWLNWSHGVPAVPVRDLRIHPREHDLVIGTHGRGIYIVDDIRPLREAAKDPSLLIDELRVLPMAPAQKYVVAEAIGYRSVGHAMMFGEMRPYGALINYWYRGVEGASVIVEVHDEENMLVHSLVDFPQKGVNRKVWDLKRTIREEGGADLRGVEVLAGNYTVKIKVLDIEMTGNLEVIEDPRFNISIEDRLEKVEALGELQSLTSTLETTESRLGAAIETVGTVLHTLRIDGEDKALIDKGVALEQLLKTTLEELFTGPLCQGSCSGTVPGNVVIQTLSRTLESSMGGLSSNETLMLSQSRNGVEEIVGRVNAIFDSEVLEYSEELGDYGYSPFSGIGRIRTPGEEL
jgi:photosystem II stability/assembly factor-like uncharacterized protein